MSCHHLRFLIGGGSGFVGTALTNALKAQGHSVTWISRTVKKGHITWERLKADGLPECDVVINLAGQHILDLKRPWNDAYKQELLASRVETTKLLVDAVNATTLPPPSCFISTAGKCFYGVEESGSPRDVILDEYNTTPHEIDFAASMVHLWETAADHLDRVKVRRHIRVNLGVVCGSFQHRTFPLLRVGRLRGFLPIIRLPFCFGLGGYLGDGEQLFPWVHIEDVTRLFLFLVNHAQCDGRYNAVAPGIVTNKQFTDAFACALNRPVRWSIPSSWVEAVVGPERSSILLKGQNIHPTRTLESGFVFKFPEIDKAMEDLVKITF